MKDSFDSIKKKIKLYFRKTSLFEFFFKKIAPVIFYILLGMVLTILMLNHSRSGHKGSVSELDIPISSTVDLPTQIKELQSQQSLVLEKQLENITTSTDESTDVSEIITQLNQRNEIDTFLDDLISLNYKDDIETQYKILSKYLSEDSASNRKTTVEADTYKLLGGDSWSKTSKSNTAKTGTSIISLLSGSNKEERYYQVIVPATNEERENATLIYFISTNNNGKILKCVYGGVLENRKNESVYKDLANIYSK